MRILAVDAGNSRIKWGVHAGGSWQVQGWIPTPRAARIAAAWAKLEPPALVIAANVAGARVERALAAAARRLGRGIRFLKSSAAQCGAKA